ncbi:hypothetical protein N3K66_000960 [Trichothecium roseum]|uniref:Uncharacterized protein n=1 Tax=Trichothecium roseum TaxID=47278 RepID=A0ACC0VEX1_9HYPO|nr:hypothetical protein N3K66_000960 [Trichothecium roseum]
MNSKGSAIEGEGEGEAYVAYTWVNVFAQRRVDLDAELSEQVPVPFERLRESILSFRQSEGEGEGVKGPGQTEARDDGDSDIGFFVVCTGSRDWIPEEIRQRAQPPVSCDQCDATFDDWFSRQRHRNTEHGSQEGGNPLPHT